MDRSREESVPCYQSRCFRGKSGWRKAACQSDPRILSSADEPPLLPNSHSWERDGEREAQVSDECIKSGRFNHKGADSLREYNRFTQYHCDKQNANASHFTSRSNLQTSHLWHVLIYESISLRGRNTDTARYLTVYYRQWERKKWILESFQLDNLIWILIILFIETINQMYTAEYGRGTNVTGLLYKHKHCSNQIQQLQVSSNFSVHTDSENTVQLDRSHQIGLSNHILCLKCGCVTNENSFCAATV